MKAKLYIIFILTHFLTLTVFSQHPNQEVKTIKVLHNEQYEITSLGLRLTDSNTLPNGNYDNNEYYQITFYSDEYHDNYKLNLNIELFDIAVDDTLFIYDGATTNSPLLYQGNNSNSCLLQQFYATTNFVTIIFKSNDIINGRGFSINIIYNKPCQDIKLSWDSIFYLKNSHNIISKKNVKHIVDTTNDFFYTFDICEGTEVHIPVKVTFPENDNYYHQSVSDLLFRWDLGEGDVKYIHGDSILKHTYKKTQGYDINLQVIDTNGCTSKNLINGRVRIAPNPIQTIFDLSHICSFNTIDINISESDTSDIILQYTKYDNTFFNYKPHKQFLPDGPYCDSTCFYSPIIINEFSNNQKLVTGDDIATVCINMEHEYMGDLEISLICPEGQKAILKYKPEENGYNPNHIIDYPGGGGGNYYFGLPYGGNQHLQYDGRVDSTICDSLYNIPGMGWNYCWSTNTSYGYWDVNHNYNNTYDKAIYVTKPPAQTFVEYDFGDTIPIGYKTNNHAPGRKQFYTTDSSYLFTHQGFYKPSTDFNSLIGCSLNGEWNIEICDTWTRDNGWIFSWYIEFCNSYETDWTYNVGIDTILWHNNLNLDVNVYNKNYIDVTPHDTNGQIPLYFTVIDSLQCYWDSLININVVKTPKPYLGEDTIICAYTSIRLSAQNDYDNNYTYLWKPSLETTPTIQTIPTNQSILYELTVTNNINNTKCSNKDDILVEIADNPEVKLSIDTIPFITGCEPLTINITNYTQNVIKHYWDFGDGDNSKSKNVKHTYSAGIYDLLYKATNDRGCQSMIILDSFIHVYTTPKPKFKWSPELPTMFEPTVQLHNLSMPNNYDDTYSWLIQYDKNNINDFHIIQEYEPKYTFQQFNNTSITGEYIVKLVAMSNNLTPNNNYVICSDTTTDKILIVNDFLQFPNVVTPNGDGINDIFKIVNLVEHIGFPICELTILNRWGKIIYYKKNIDINTDFWDPNITNTPTGTYFYRFTAKGYITDIQRNGVIEVLR